jgi:hypothetical protein
MKLSVNSYLTAGIALIVLALLVTVAASLGQSGRLRKAMRKTRCYWVLLESIVFENNQFVV